MSGLPHQSDREKARKEAQECLDAMRQEGFQLDGFNLLGVVADPRSGMMSPSHLMQGTRSSFQHDAAGESEDANNSSDIFSDAFQSLTEQMNSVTEQIDTFNMFLEELSKEYLGDDSGESLLLEYYYQDEEALEVEDRLELSNVSLDTINAYLEECGDLAHDLFTKGLETRTRTDSHQKEAGDGEKNCLEEIPQVFCEDSFDLFHSKTFVQLLLEGEEDDVKKSKETNSLYQPTQKLVLLKEPDSLARYLDRIELALQEQVRQKAGAFFQETTRFRQLQSSISDLLEQVLTLRKYVNSISSVMKQTNDISSHQRQNYEEFVDLMDSALDLIRCKGSIGGLLSANDHLGAAQQIQYGRKLLQGQFDQLSALSTCGEQFRQYQSLVTQSLSEELVDAFFHWKKENDTERVKEVVEALNLCQAMSNTGEVYTRRLQQTIRMTVRTTIAEFVESSSSNGKGGSGVTGMSYEAFYDCLQLLMEELLTVLNTAQNVDVFCVAEDIFSEGQSRWTNETVITGADLAAKSIAELLRLRKEAHSLINLDSMKQLWDTCMQFTTSVEESFSEDNKIIKAVGLRSTLVGQAKAFLDRTHESNMSVLVAALDSERWTQCEISTERQAELTRLCTGRAIAFSSTKIGDSKSNGNDTIPSEKKPMAQVEGTNYKVVWSCLLLVEMIMTNLTAAAHFQSFAAHAVNKVTELLRLFNTRTTHFVLGAGAIHSAARLKSINAKHLSMVTQCLGMILALLPHIRAALMAQLPSKQHTLLSDLDKIKKDYVDHSEKVLNKFVTIIGGIVEHGLAPRIATTDFDARARDLPLNDSPKVECCVFLDGISSSTRKMHQVLSALLPPDHLQDVFSRIFAYVDTKVPTLFINAAAVNSNTSDGSSSFQFPKSDKGKLRLISEVEYTMKALNKLPGALPWDFTAMNVLARKLDYQLPQKAVPPPPELLEEETKEPTDNLKDENTSYKPTQSAEDKEYRNESNEQESPVEEEVTPVENGNS